MTANGARALPRNSLATQLRSSLLRNCLGGPGPVQMNLSQIVTGSEKHRDPRLRPYAFTEQGVAMLSSVLRSKRAITVNIEIMRALVKLRQMLASNAELSRRLDELESKYDKQFRVVFDAIRQLMATPVRNRKEIGFRSRSAKK